MTREDMRRDIVNEITANMNQAMLEKLIDARMECRALGHELIQLKVDAEDDQESYLYDCEKSAKRRWLRAIYAALKIMEIKPDEFKRVKGLYSMTDLRMDQVKALCTLAFN